ncbi:MAG: glycerol kinase GlpK, partial [Lachnospiraceae bacterium]|nr:glycerol kinase GlpK [Lachnospiraceae bacterium]
MGKYVIAIDEGTTSTRCVIYDDHGETVTTFQREFRQIYPKPGWVEHDANEIWNAVLVTVRTALTVLGATAADIDSIGITNQRETTVIWDKLTGEPVYNAIVWQCRRSSDIIDHVIKEGYAGYIRKTTGLIPDAYFSASKIKWILDNVAGVRERAERGELLFGTIDTWLLWKLTGGQVHATDYTNASRTMLFDIHSLKWDEKLLDIFEVPEVMLPKALPSSMVYGKTQSDLFGGEITISGIAGDQQSALFGQCCFEKGSVKNTYGTGCFLLMNTGDTAVESRHDLVTTIGADTDGKIVYVLEGSVFIGGAAVQWLRDEIGVLSSSAESFDYASSVSDTLGAYVVPAFSGLGAPYWNQGARGVVVGITRGFGRAHLVRATLEGIDYQVLDILKAMEQDIGMELTSLKVDGGACANDFLMQFQSDIINRTVIRPDNVETTSLGAAYLAGLATGFYESKEAIRRNVRISKT